MPAYIYIYVRGRNIAGGLTQPAPLPLLQERSRGAMRLLGDIISLAISLRERVCLRAWRVCGTASWRRAECCSNLEFVLCTARARLFLTSWSGWVCVCYFCKLCVRRPRVGSISSICLADFFIRGIFALRVFV